MVWVVCALALLAIGFSLTDAIRQQRGLRRLERGGFDVELAEIEREEDPDLARALRNELTLSLEAALAVHSARKGVHARICGAAGVAAVVISVQHSPALAASSAAIAALAVAATAGLDRSARQVAKSARSRWRARLGTSERAVRHGVRARRNSDEFQSG